MESYIAKNSTVFASTIDYLLPTTHYSTMEKKKSDEFEPVGDPEKWEKGNKISVAQILKIKKNNRLGISFKVGRKLPYMDRPSGFWIDGEFQSSDLIDWFEWFGTTLKKLYYKLTGRAILLSEDIIQLEKQKEDLTANLVKIQTQLEEAKKLEVRQKEINELAQKSVSNLESFRNIFDNFKKMIQNSVDGDQGMEEKIKSEIKEHNWLVGLECHVEAKNVDIDNQTEIDLHVKTKYGQDRIFELKSPHLNPFVRKGDDKSRRFTISPTLADGLSEIVSYMRKTDIYSASAMEGTYGIQKASGIIVIGYNLEDSELQMLRELNFHLAPHIRIITYNDLIKNIDSEIKIIESIKSSETKTEHN